MKVENTYQNQSNVGFDSVHGMGYKPVEIETNDSFTIKPDISIINGDTIEVKPSKRPLPADFGITDITPLLPEAKPKPLPKPEIKPIKPQPKPAKPKPQPEIKPAKPQPKPAKPKPQPAKPGNGKIRLK